MAQSPRLALGMTQSPADTLLHSEASFKRTVFFVRHGESEWNRGKESWSMDAVCKMARRHDHELSSEGINQALQLEGNILRVNAQILKNRSFGTSDAENAFVQARTILCSPLTRAVETATVGLRPLLANESGTKIRLVKEAREHRKLGGRDSVGTEIGSGVKDKVRACLQKKLGDVDTAEYDAIINDINIDDVSVQWWDARPESKSALHDRLRVFVEELRNIPAEEGPIIVVAHSYFIQETFCRYARQGRPKKIPNCGVVAATFEFFQSADPQIIFQKSIFNAVATHHPGLAIRFLAMASGPRLSAAISLVILVASIVGLFTDSNENLGYAIGIVREVGLALLLAQSLQQFLFPRNSWMVTPLWLAGILVFLADALELGISRWRE